MRKSLVRSPVTEPEFPSPCSMLQIILGCYVKNTWPLVRVAYVS